MHEQQYEQQQDRWALWHIASLAVLAAIALTQIL